MVSVASMGMMLLSHGFAAISDWKAAENKAKLAA